MSRAARVCWAIERNHWLIAAANIIAGLTFVAGSIAFYSPGLFAPGVSLFLTGSLLMLVAAVADAYRRYGPSQ